MKLSDVPPAGAENVSVLGEVWEQERMQAFDGFVCGYNNEDNVPKLEVMHMLVEIYNNKGTDMTTVRRFLPNMANVCLHISISANFCPSTESDRDATKSWKRYRWSTINSFYTWSCCWDSRSQVHKRLQVNCRKKCSSTLTLLIVSNYVWKAL